MFQAVEGLNDRDVQVTFASSTIDFLICRCCGCGIQSGLSATLRCLSLSERHPGEASACRQRKRLARLGFSATNSFEQGGQRAQFTKQFLTTQDGEIKLWSPEE